MVSVMTNNIVQFPHGRSVRQPIAQFLRLGDSGHIKLAAIHAIGGLPASRVVVDVSFEHLLEETGDQNSRSKPVQRRIHHADNAAEKEGRS